MCVDCGCCQAKVYAAGDPLCWACDAGSHPLGKLDVKKTPAADVPPIRLQPATPAPKCEVEQEEEVKEQFESKAGRRIPEEIRATILAEPASVSNCEVARRCGVSEPTARLIRLKAGIRSTSTRGRRAHQKLTKTAPAATPKPADAIEKKHSARPALIQPQLRKVSVTVQIDEPSADAYWAGLTLEQKAATIELQMQAILTRTAGDQRVAVRV